MEYKLLEADSCDELNRLVSNQIKQGWELYGSPIISFAGAGTSYNCSFKCKYAQALIKRKHRDEQ